MTNALLWEIRKDDAPKSFLFGTIHVYDSRVFNIPAMIFRLIDSVDVYLPEADNRHVAHGDMMNYMLVDDSDYSLRDYLSPENYDRIMDIVSVDAEIIDRYKPFFVASLIFADKDMPSDSIDAELLHYAAMVGKTVCELESFEEQIAAIDSIPYREQAEIIERSLLSTDCRGDFIELMNSYRDQNLQALNENLKEMNPPELFIDSIQRNRNIRMSDKIDLLLQQRQSLFIAVGAMHIPDTDDVKGIVSILTDKGYTVEALDFSFNR
jgi:uncharacterized protein YbaP (TraB family)